MLARLSAVRENVYPRFDDTLHTKWVQIFPKIPFWKSILGLNVWHYGFFSNGRFNLMNRILNSTLQWGWTLWMNSAGLLWSNQIQESILSVSAFYTQIGVNLATCICAVDDFVLLQERRMNYAWRQSWQSAPPQPTRKTTLARRNEKNDIYRCRANQSDSEQGFSALQFRLQTGTQVNCVFFTSDQMSSCWGFVH